MRHLQKAQIVLSERTQCPIQISHTVAKEKVNKVIGPLKISDTKTIEM